MKKFKIMMIALSMPVIGQASWRRLFAVRVNQEQIAPINKMMLRFHATKQFQQGLTAGVDINARDNYGSTVLMNAVGQKDENRVCTLLNQGADVNAQDDRGCTPLIKAISLRHKNVARMLLDKGADINVQDDRGYTALAQAVSDQLEDIVRMLLDKGADPNLRDFYGQQVLMYAARDGRENMVRMLIDAGADGDARDVFDFTALMDAACYGYENIARLLLESGANVNAAYEAYTALIGAAFNRRENVVRLLLGWNNQRDVLLTRNDISDAVKAKLVPLESATVQDTFDRIQAARQDQANGDHRDAMRVSPAIMDMLQDYLDMH